MRCALVLLVAAFLPCWSQAPIMEPGPKSPTESLKCIKMRPGFTVELMAAEPLVMDPIAFAWGPDGKLWVVEMGDYPLGAGGKNKPGGRIKFLEKTGKGGVGRPAPSAKTFSGEPQATAAAPYDKATVFLDNLGYPTGVHPWGKGVIVICAPDIFYAEDTDGDGKADNKIVLFTGFGEGNQQHRANGFAWGLDGWLYGANGDSGGVIKVVSPLSPSGKGAGGEGPAGAPRGSKTVDIRGRDFRIKPDEGLIEAQSGQSQFGRARDDWGNWFGNNNSNPMWHYVLDDHYLRRNPFLLPPDPRVHVSVTPGAAPVYPISKPLPRFNSPAALNHFTSACSAIVYRDNLFGPEFENNTFVSEPVHNLIHREIMKPKGVTFTSQRAADEQKSEFLASTDNWFRPTMIQTGPDGALWVADMYRYVIEHPQWIPAEWQKKLDLRAGHDMGRIYRIYPEGKKPRAIPRLDKLTTTELVAALDSPSGWQRDMAQQLLIKKRDMAAVPMLRDIVHKLFSKKPNPLLVVHALYTLDGLGALQPHEFAGYLYAPDTEVRRHAIRLSEPLLKYTVVARQMASLWESANPRERMQVAYSLGAWDSAEAGKWLGRLAQQDADDRYLLAAVLSSVNKQNWETFLEQVLSGAKDKPLPQPLLENLLRLANGFGTVRDKATLLAAVAGSGQGKVTAEQIVILANLLDALDQSNQSLAKMWAEGDGELRTALKRLGGIFDKARTLVSDIKAARAEQMLAIRLLGRGLDQHKEDVLTLSNLLGPQSPDDFQVAALATLGRLSDASVPGLLIGKWKSFGPELRPKVMDVLLSKNVWLQETLTAIEKKTIAAAEVDAVRRQRLLDHKNADVRSRAAKVFAAVSNPDRQKLIDSYKAAAAQGDVQKGSKIFAKICAACHRLGDIGQQVGPDLASVGDKSPEGLLVAILDPNRAVEARYVSYSAVTKNGTLYAGLLEGETSTSITLVAADGKKHNILRKDLDELFSSGKSAMPEGLEKDISPADMGDLVAFLRSSLPTPKRKMLAGNEPALVQADQESVLNLLPKNGAVYGPNIVLETKHGNLGEWTSPEDHVIWSVEVPTKGRYVVWLNWACADASAGNHLVIQTAGEKLAHQVAGTGTWDIYRRAKIGVLTLPQGRYDVTVRSLGPIRGALLDLKGIQIAPETPY